MGVERVGRDDRTRSSEEKTEIEDLNDNNNNYL